MRWLGRALLALLVAAAGLFAFGPYEEVDLTRVHDTAGLTPETVETYLAASEAEVPKLREGVEKRVIWAGAPGQRSDWAVVYVHGFSATSEEIRPVPDRVAAELGANLVFTRLEGHGQDGMAMATATVADWAADVAEALDIGRVLGERVLVISTSTGGTLVAGMAGNPVITDRVAGVVFVSPNFGINSGFEPLLTMPAARYWLPLIAGETRSFEPANDLQAAFWTTEYPSVAVMPMAALVRHVNGMDLSLPLMPALFIAHPEDQVVRFDATRRVIASWGTAWGGGNATHVTPPSGAGIDPLNHVVAGDILSPAGTGPAVTSILEWVRALD